MQKIEDTNNLLAEEALWLGASFAHIAAYYEKMRLDRIARFVRENNRMRERSTRRFAA